VKTENKTSGKSRHLVASVFVEDDEEYRHDDYGSEQYQRVA